MATSKHTSGPPEPTYIFLGTPHTPGEITGILDKYGKDDIQLFIREKVIDENLLNVLHGYLTNRLTLELDM